MIKEVITEIQEKYQLSDYQLAKKLQCAPSTVWRIRNGARSGNLLRFDIAHTFTDYKDLLFPELKEEK